MKIIRHGLSEAIGRPLSLADMAKLCGLKDYARRPDGQQGNGQDRYRRWEEGDGPSGPVAMLLSIYASAVPARSDSDEDAYFREVMRDIIRARLAGES